MSMVEIKKKNSEGLVWYRLFFTVIMLLMAGVFLFGQFFCPEERAFSAFRGNAENLNCYAFETGWNCTYADGTSEYVENAEDCKSTPGELVVMTATLPEGIEDNQCIYIHFICQQVKIYVGGELRQEYNTDETRPVGTETASAFVYVPLEEGDSGKELRIETITGTSYSGTIKEMYIGEQYGILCQLILENGGSGVYDVVLILLTGICIVVCVVTQALLKRKIPLIYLAWVLLICGLWLLSESVFRQFIVSNLSVFSFLTFWSLMTIPFPFLIYVNSIQEGRYQKYYLPASILTTVNFVYQNVMLFVFGQDMWFNLSKTHIAIGVTILILVVTITVDLLKKRAKKYMLVVVGILGLLLCAVFEMVLYYLNPNWSIGSILACGLLFLLTMAVAKTVKDLVFMEREKQRAIASGESKARFLANMSHEIRTPINSIVGVNEMILRECKEPAIRDYAKDISVAAQTLHGMINDILDISKIESGKMEVNNGEYDFADLIYGLYRMMNGKAKDKGLVMNLDVEEDLPVKLFGDDVKLRQILVNLISNAVKYTKEGSVTITVSGKKKKDNIVLYFEVKDTGIGIKEEDLSKIAVAFERLEEDKNRHIEGTGLGMNITLNLINILGSTLDMQSEYGKGSTFSFVLEQTVVDASPIGNIDEWAKLNEDVNDYYKSGFHASNAEILVVDDNAMNRMVFQGLLKETGVHVTQADSGRECLELIKTKHFDLVFMDHMMPEMDGIETFHNMRKQKENLCKDTPVIVLTANAISGAREKYMAEGFDEYLTKPIMPAELEKTIKRFLPAGLIQQDAETENKKEEKALSVDLLPVEGISWDVAAKYFPDKENLCQAVQDFYRKIPEEAKALREMAGELDNADGVKQYRIRVHSMKSSAMLIGATYLAGAAKFLEDAARKEKVDLLKAATDSFLEEWLSYREKLEENVESHLRGDKETVEDVSVILGLLSGVSSAAKSMDLDFMDENMEHLRKYRYAPAVQEDMDRLADAVTELEQEEILKICDRLVRFLLEEGCR